MNCTDRLRAIVLELQARGKRRAENEGREVNVEATPIEQRPFGSILRLAHPTASC